jgi:Flp pilus assembly protein CpaB
MIVSSLRRRLPRATIVWLAVATGCAALAFGLVRDLAARAAEGGPAPTATVVVAARDVEAGHALEVDDLALAPVPLPEPPAALDDVSRAIGKVTVTPLLAGETVTATRLAEGGGSLAIDVPPGFLGVTLGVSAVPEGLVPGDRVDVLATFSSARPYTTTVADDVAVLRVPGQGSGAFGAAGGTERIVVVVAPEIARQLVHAGATGALAIAVRGYEPVPVAPTGDG